MDLNKGKRIPTEYLTKILPDTLRIDDDLMVHKITSLDIEWLVEFATDTKINRYIPWAKDINTKEASLRLIEMWKTNKRTVRYVIESSGVACGYIGIWPDTEGAAYQTGSGLLPEYRGKGIVNKAFVAIEQELLAKNDIQEFAAYVDETNISSRRMLIKRGYVPTESFNDSHERRYVKHVVFAKAS